MEEITRNKYLLSCWKCMKRTDLYSYPHRNRLMQVSGILFLCKACGEELAGKYIQIELVKNPAKE